MNETIDWLLKNINLISKREKKIYIKDETHNFMVDLICSATRQVH